MVKPLFKWAGGKRKMLDKYDTEVFQPRDLRCKVFVDMFAGAGTMSLWAYQNRDRLGLERIILNDLNDELIHMYMVMKDHMEEFVGTCLELQKGYFESTEKQFRKDVYLSWRAEYADGKPEGIRKASLLFCMLKTNFNGIWQSRAGDGVYYTPFGNGNESKGFINEDELKEFKAMLDMAEITCKSFEEVDCLKEEYEGAFFYADPPYLASFTKYKHKKGDLGFGTAETERLIQYLHGKHQEGAKFGFSNKQNEFFDGRLDSAGKVYDFNKIKYTASRKDTARATSGEILWTNL